MFQEKENEFVEEAIKRIRAIGINLERDLGQLMILNIYFDK